MVRMEVRDAFVGFAPCLCVGRCESVASFLSVSVSVCVCVCVCVCALCLFPLVFLALVVVAMPCFGNPVTRRGWLVWSGLFCLWLGGWLCVWLDGRKSQVHHVSPGFIASLSGVVLVGRTVRSDWEMSLESMTASAHPHARPPCFRF